MAEAITFELSKCYETAIRERELQVLANVDADLVATVAAGLGLPAPEPTEQVADVEAEPGAGPDREGMADHRSHHRPADRPPGRHRGFARLQQEILDAGMVGLIIAPTGGTVPADGGEVSVQRTYVTARSVEYDALVLADGIGAEPADPRLAILLSETYRHGKAILGWGDAVDVFEAMSYLPADGLIQVEGADAVLAAAQAELAQHRDWERLAQL